MEGLLNLSFDRKAAKDQWDYDIIAQAIQQVGAL
jgi:hypothetical protein